MKILKAIAVSVNDYIQLDNQLDEQLKHAAYIDRGDIKLSQYVLIVEFPLQVVSRALNGDYWESDRGWSQ